MNIYKKALTNVPVRLSYRSGRDDLVADFFIPCMEMATVYRRAAGYFSSQSLALAARGIASLASRHGKMRLVVSPHLQSDDLDVLQSVADKPATALLAIASKSLIQIEDALVVDRLNALAWLAATGMLEIKIALCVGTDGKYRQGIYHEKIGIFSDDDGNHVAFSGSSNETAGGFIENFESIKAFCSWKDAEGRVQEEIDNFEALWSNTTPGLRVIEFSSAGRELLERYRVKDNPPPGINPRVIAEKKLGREFRVPDGVELRKYQKDAILAWSQAGGCGIFAMATGAGKTITALALASKVAEKNRPLIVVVLCPFINLCKQWMSEFATFGLEPVACYDGRNKWEDHIELMYQRLVAKLTSVEAVVVTNATYGSHSFQRNLKVWESGGSAHILLIADEVHNLGSEKIQNMLPEGVRLRLGLSATPERHNDPVGTENVLNYFGGIVFEYGIQKAIIEDRLCQYQYFPIPVELTEDEILVYEEISNKLVKFIPQLNSGVDVSEFVMSLLIRRSRLLGSAANKIIELDKVMSELKERPRKAIFYCGDGRTTDPVTEDEVRQIESVTKLLGEKHELRVRTFTAREGSEEREEILRNLRDGFLDGIVAIRCLDEGIDIPELSLGFILASSTNPRQFIQRRGRLLRKVKGKERAVIYDFFVSPPQGEGELDESRFNMERSLLKRELARVEEFCRMAENGPSALHSLGKLRLKYNLLATQQND